MKSQKRYQIITLCFFALTLWACQAEKITAPAHLVPLTVDENAQLPAIEINGTRLHAYAKGEVGDPVVITLHGGPGGDHLELTQFEALVDSGYRVVFWDQRGAGLSRRHHPEIYTQEIYLEDLLQLVNYYTQSPEEKVTLLGHSWGAMYATMFVNTYPERVERLILSEPGGFTEAATIDYVTTTQSIAYLSEWSNDLVWMEQFMSPSKKWFSQEDHELFDYQYLLGAGIVLEQSFNGEDGEQTYPVNRFGAVVGLHLPKNSPGFDWTTNLDQYSDEVLFFYSELNPGYHQDHLNTVTSAYQNIEVHQIKGVGHELMIEGFDQVFPLVIDYLKKK